MPRYAVVNNISGVVRGVTTASDPVSACRLLDGFVDGGRLYEEHDPRSRSAHATTNAYAVYEAVGDLLGRDEITAAKAAGLVKVAVVVILQPLTVARRQVRCGSARYS